MPRYIFEIRTFINKKKYGIKTCFSQTDKSMWVQEQMRNPMIDKIRVTEMQQNTGFTHSITRYDRIDGKWKMRVKPIGEDDE